MIDEWSIKNEIIEITQCWPMILTFCLIGCLIGWIVSLVLPSPYRATKELYVGLNVHQVSNGQNQGKISEAPIRYIDDYKNWQMSSLNSAIFTKDIIDETLSRLREKDSSWEKVNRDELAKSLHVYWRNAGKWRLVAENQDPLFAYQAITVWQIVVLEKVNEAILVSSQASEILEQQKSLIQMKSNKQEIIVQNDQIINELVILQNKVTELSNDLYPDDSFLNSLQKNLIKFNSSSAILSHLDNYPSPNATKVEYQKWINSYIQLLELENDYINEEIERLEEQKQELSKTHQETIKKSLGLSPDLVVDGITTEEKIIEKLRPTSLMILIGGTLGLIAWAFFHLAKLSMNTK